jgi:DNA-binding NarL/FixJ family response regulator
MTTTIRPIRILVTDDHAVLRAGLTALLNAEADFVVVGEAADGNECLRVAQALQPDVILLDINMPGLNGLDALPLLRQAAPKSRVLVLTMHDDITYLRQVLRAGGVGYVLKQAADKELLSAIRTVYNGGTFLHPNHAQALLADPALTAANAPSNATPKDDAKALAQLSEREQETLKLIALGYSNKEIAEKLYLSVKTVETYKARIMEKLDVTTRAALVRFALQHKLLDEPE